MKHVLYTGAFRFPDQDAAAFRVYSVARLFVSVGCHVTFAGWERAQQGQNNYTFKGHDCYPQSEFREHSCGLISRLLGFVTRGAKTLKWLKTMPHFDVIVAYNPPALFSLRLLLLCWYRRTCLILDNTEWYEAEHLPGGRFGPAAVENWLRMRVLYPRFRNVICMSSFMERYYDGRNIAKIPPLKPSVEARTRDIGESAREPIASGVNFIYAGNSGKKDRLAGFIRALPIVAQALQCKVLLRIAGMEEAELHRLLRDSGLSVTTYAAFIECYGWVSAACVSQLYDQSHFSILVREDKRYAWAGFPTKAVESWSHGCPIITNRIGDLGVLADDMMDAIIIGEEDIARKLPLVLAAIIESGRYMAMSSQSRLKASRLFSNDAHVPNFERFFQNLGQPHKECHHDPVI